MENKTLYSNLIIQNITTGKILFLKRSETCKLEPRKWCLPGGHIEEYETPDEAALREAAEEVGFDFRNHLIPFRIGMYQNSRAICYYFTVYVDDPDKYGILRLDMSEHQNCAWLTPMEAMKKLDFMLDLGDQMQAMFAGVQAPVTNNIRTNTQPQ
jgi:8-oxo-dGTP pyrophosphatase MutT (NUDIX family)